MIYWLITTLALIRTHGGVAAVMAFIAVILWGAPNILATIELLSIIVRFPTKMFDFGKNFCTSAACAVIKFSKIVNGA